MRSVGAVIFISLGWLGWPAHAELTPLVALVPHVPPPLQAMAVTPRAETGQLSPLGAAQASVTFSISSLQPWGVAEISPTSLLQAMQPAAILHEKPLALLQAAAPERPQPLIAHQPALPQTTVALRQLAPAAASANTELARLAEPLPATPPNLLAMAQPARPAHALIAMQGNAAPVPKRLLAMAALPAPPAGPLQRMGPAPAAGAAVLISLNSAIPSAVAAAVSGANRTTNGWAQVVAPQGIITPLQAVAAAQQTLQPPEVAASPAFANPYAWATPLKGETEAAEGEIFLAYLLDNQPLGDANDLLSARQDAEGRVYLPLQAVANSLGFPIRVDALAGRAAGWLMTPTRTLVLDTNAGTVALNGQTREISASSILREGTDLFIAAEELSRWLPVNFRVELSELALYAASTERLPMATRLARQRQWASRNPQRMAFDGPRHVLENPRFGWPDLRLNLGASVGNRVEGIPTTFGVQGRGPLGGMESFINLGFTQGGLNEEGLTDASWRLAQRQPSATLGEGLLGPLAGRSLELGDVAIASAPLLLNRTTGVGVAFSNAPNSFVNNLNDFVLQGEASPGWDVEVYRNGSLTTFGTVGANGRYRFENLNLSSGLNDFKVVLYGPYGEREERTASFRVGQGLVGSGEVVYSVGALATSGQLIPTASAEAPQGGGTVVLNSTLGLTDWLALNTGVAAGPLGAGTAPEAGATVGLRVSTGPLFTELDYAMLDDGSTGYSGRTSLRVLDDVDLSAFITKLASGTTDTTQASRIYGFGVADSIRLTERGTPFRYGFGFSRNEYLNAAPIDRFSANQAWQLGRVNFNNTLGLQRSNERTRFEPGTLEFSTRVANLPLRGGLTYQLEGEDFITSAGLSTQVRLGDDAAENILSLGVRVEPAAGSGGATAGLQTRVGPVSVGLNTSYNSNQTFQAGVNLGLALASAGDRLAYTVADPSREGFGFASADVLLFADDNANGRRDAGEETIAGATVANLRSAKLQTTNAAGVARFTDLLPNTDTAIQIQEDSLPDLYLRPTSAIHILQARNGFGGTVALPLQRLGEVGGQLVGVPAAQLEQVRLWLANAAGATVQETSTDDTGFFNFAPVLLGTYTLNAQAKGGAVVSVPINLSRNNNVLPEIMLRLPPPLPSP